MVSVAVESYSQSIIIMEVINKSKNEKSSNKILQSISIHSAQFNTFSDFAATNLLGLV